ncbi:MAG: hypothetical protein RMY29_010830 [Nostoc sp. CreGUA01]|nr:hypothetical protein [Nostoc sp. CreGUA01]
MAKLQHSYPGKLLGAGRSGQVFLVANQEVLLARKIFYTNKITSIIHYFLFGSPNPYVWNKDAIKCAFFRRQILSELVQFWFDDNLKVAEAIATSWNQDLKAYQMDTKFLSGRHIDSYHGFSCLKPSFIAFYKLPSRKYPQAQKR